MAFPDVIVECAFENDVNEYLYAQAGYSDITQFVKSISGTLRGRSYELDAIETGSISLTLDNADGRFTPGSLSSPYYPNVKPSRRLRVRGRNLQRSQIATAGSTLRSTEGFERSQYVVSSYPTDPVLVESRVAGVSPLITKRTNYANNPSCENGFKWASNNGTLYPSTLDDTVSRSGTSSTKSTSNGASSTTVLSLYAVGHANTSDGPSAAAGEVWTVSVYLKANDKPLNGRIYITWQDSTGAIISTSVATAPVIPIDPSDGWVQVYCTATAPAGTSRFYSVATATLQTGNAVAGDCAWADDALLEKTGSVLDFFYGDTESNLQSDGTANDYRWTSVGTWRTSEELNHPIGAGTHHVEVTVPSGTPAGTHGLLRFNVPIELGRRLNHSVYVWRVSGTEPTGTMSVNFMYYDADGNRLTPNAGNGWNLPSPSTPTRRYSYGGHTPPPTAVECQCEVLIAYTAASTSAVTYAFDAIQTEDTPNLAPNPYGRWDAKDWYVTGDANTTPTNGPMWVQMVADAGGGDLEFYTLIGGLVPGETYTACGEFEHENSGGGTPTTNLQITADGGQTTTAVGGKAVYETGVYTFVATDTTQKLAVQIEGGDLLPAGHVIKVRRLNVQPGDTSPGLFTEETSADVTAWDHPKPIFEGWVESWPIRVTGESNEVTVVANDRLKRIGDITLDSTWREAVFADQMECIIPFDDDPVDAGGKVAQIGTWASSDQIIDVPLLSTKGDLGAASYTLGVDGPASPTAIDLDAVSDHQGFFVQMDYSKDYVYVPPPPPPPPTQTTYTPPPPAPTYTYKTYTKVYYATWSRTFDGDGGTTWDDSEYCYQGYFDGNRGLTRSLIGFNYKTIMADLAGATVKSCYFTATNAHWYYYGGGTAYIGTHSYSSKPSSWSDGSVHQNRIAKSWGYQTKQSNSLGTTIGNEFKSGASRGISFGPPPYGLKYYGYFRGATLSGKPYLTITFTRKVLA